MSYVKTPTLVGTAGSMHGSSVQCAGNTQVYANLVWNSTPVAEATLLASQITLMRKRIDDKIRDEANAQRNQKTVLVLGTQDAEQLRTYEEKYEEASAYLVYNATPTPIMNAEVAHTGETVATLAPLVVSQYESAKATLRTMYGDIEGVRRANIAIINSYTLLSELQAYTGPTWS